jgi:hypothetical protein
VIVADLRDGQEWYVGPAHQVVVDGERFPISKIARLTLRSGEVKHLVGRNAAGNPAHAIVFQDPVTGVDVMLELEERVAQELGDELTRGKIQVATAIPRGFHL